MGDAGGGGSGLTDHPEGLHQALVLQLLADLVEDALAAEGGVVLIPDVGDADGDLLHVIFAVDGLELGPEELLGHHPGGDAVQIALLVQLLLIADGKKHFEGPVGGQCILLVLVELGLGGVAVGESIAGLELCPAAGHGGDVGAVALGGHGLEDFVDIVVIGQHGVGAAEIDSEIHMFRLLLLPKCARDHSRETLVEVLVVLSFFTSRRSCSCLSSCRPSFCSWGSVGGVTRTCRSRPAPPFSVTVRSTVIS